MCIHDFVYTHVYIYIQVYIHIHTTYVYTFIHIYNIHSRSKHRDIVTGTVDVSLVHCSVISLVSYLRENAADVCFI